MNKAIFSSCRQYRFSLWREWDKTKPYAMFIALNPSTADDYIDDPTVTRCVAFAKSWGYGGLCMTNLFAFRATDPQILKNCDDPVGEDNDHYLFEIAKNAAVVVAAWGNHGRHLDRAKQVRKLIADLYYLKINKTGEPAHPLYLNANLVPLRLDLY